MHAFKLQWKISTFLGNQFAKFAILAILGIHRPICRLGSFLVSLLYTFVHIHLQMSGHSNKTQTYVITGSLLTVLPCVSFEIAMIQLHIALNYY